MITTIQLDKKIKSKLDELRVYPRETYNEIIARLLNSGGGGVEEKSLIETIEVLSDSGAMRDIAEALDEIDKGRGKSFDELKKELKINV